MCVLSWAVRWWSCLRHASSSLQIWTGRSCSETVCSKRYRSFIEVCSKQAALVLGLIFSSFIETTVFSTVGRLYLTGSSMSGLGCRSSDADLCLVVMENVSLYRSVPFVSAKCKTVDAHVFLNFCSLFFIYFRKSFVLFQSLKYSQGHLDTSVS